MDSNDSSSSVPSPKWGGQDDLFGSGGQDPGALEASAIPVTRHDRKLRYGSNFGSAFDQAGTPFADPIAFFTPLQMIAREKGFSMISNIRSFSALNATALGS
jgi:hypothetical protein